MWISKRALVTPIIGGDVVIKLITTAIPRSLKDWRAWRDPDDKDYRRDMRHALGLWHSARNTIVIDVSLPCRSIDHTMRHELGHAIGQRLAAGADWTSDAFANGIAIALRDYEANIRRIRREAFRLSRTVKRPWVRTQSA